MRLQLSAMYRGREHAATVPREEWRECWGCARCLPRLLVVSSRGKTFTFKHWRGEGSKPYTPLRQCLLAFLCEACESVRTRVCVHPRQSFDGKGVLVLHR